MKTIKIIDILTGKESPDKFKYNGYTLKKVNESYIDEDGDKLTDHICYDYSNLYDEVEVIEEDKEIESIDVEYYKTNDERYNELLEEIASFQEWCIDKVNSLENKQ
jgi:hypothetical protein